MYSGEIRNARLGFNGPVVGYANEVIPFFKTETLFEAYDNNDCNNNNYYNN